jgi:hypothetical protein
MLSYLTDTIEDDVACNPKNCPQNYVILSFSCHGTGQTKGMYHPVIFSSATY